MLGFSEKLNAITYTALRDFKFQQGQIIYLNGEICSISPF